MLAILIALAALVVATAVTAAKREARISARAPSLASWLSWIGLAAIPAGLVVAVTAHISTDVAAAPFLWVVPLALYLLTFVAVFRDRPWIAHTTVIRLVPYVIAPLAISMLGGDRAYWLVAISLHLIGFFVLTLLCHGELYRHRPEAGRLTDFYVATSIGGVVGGVFTGLIAPGVSIRFSLLLPCSRCPLRSRRGCAARPHRWRCRFWLRSLSSSFTSPPACVSPPIG
ncbi:MAG: hypothetical protein IPK23_13635 [Rhizobiales bacterium]|nr:hypothetical protein [Hyphomicrobiales bacterium]